ncbi:hypothetical protein HDV00_007119 [Rhizophlyctis rosea]|nr:hypothetical protein HDV00_007119 [Rhizophlyctis rosea]
MQFYNRKTTNRIHLKSTSTPPHRAPSSTHPVPPMKNLKKSKTFKPKGGRLPKQLEEVVYDPSARKEYLTGFHKRNVEKKKAAIEYHRKKEKEERKELRREKGESKKSLIVNDLERIEAIARGEIPPEGVDDEGDEEGVDGDAVGGEEDGGEEGSEADGEEGGTGATTRPRRGIHVSTIPSETKVTTVTVMEFDPTADDDVPPRIQSNSSDASKPKIRKVATGAVTKPKAKAMGGVKKRKSMSRSSSGKSSGKRMAKSDSRSNSKSKTGKRRK